jgi:hypothetical protein
MNESLVQIFWMTYIDMLTPQKKLKNLLLSCTRVYKMIIILQSDNLK